MDGSEIIKYAPQLTTAVTTIMAGLPLGEIVKRICGPSADLLGEKLQTRIERCFEKAIPMALEAGFDPQPVSPKILLPLLEGAALEEDEDLHSMWAALLANAASPENAKHVRPGYLTVLRQMAPDEAALLNWMALSQERSGYSSPTSLKEVALAYNELGFGPVDVPTLLGPRPIARASLTPVIQAFGTCLNSIVSNGLARRDDQQAQHDYTVQTYYVTWRGDGFVRACRPPKLKP